MKAQVLTLACISPPLKRFGKCHIDNIPIISRKVYQKLSIEKIFLQSNIVDSRMEDRYNKHRAIAQIIETDIFMP